KAPPGWSGLVAGHEPVVALAMSAANFPQLVRNFHMILQAGDLASMKPQAGRPVPATELRAWAEDVAGRKQFPQALLAIGALRLAPPWAPLFDTGPDPLAQKIRNPNLQIRISKSEPRNPKQIRNPNHRNDPFGFCPSDLFRISRFGFVSDFEIRISRFLRFGFR